MTNELLYTIGHFLLIVYICSLVLIFLFSIAQFNLLINFIKSKNKKDTSDKFDFSNPNQVPFVTVQLPIFNEIYVVERLLDNIVKLEYPIEKIDFQVLDDSTDDSVFITSKKIKELQKQGYNIQHIRRTNRKDFKAGALREGIKTAKGEFIAIFDADFLPKSNWLYQTVPYFKNPNIGAVQTRWKHINTDYSLLTKIQAFALDIHFTLEQVGRNSRGHFINFNGTAGLWRKTCIIDAGNWEGDTLTEDLDLSYRAQLKNWKFKYLVDVVTPSELPVAISAARSQQFRWNKGGAETFRKMFKLVIKTKNIPLKTKLHAILHLLNSTMFLNLIIVGILSIPMLYIKNYFEDLKLYFLAMSFFVISTFILFGCYWFVYKQIKKGGIIGLIDYFMLFIKFFSITMGFSLCNAIAVTEGHFGKKSEFVRTPKFNILKAKDNWKMNKYIEKKRNKIIWIEGILTLYFGFGLLSSILVAYIGNNKEIPSEHFDFGLFPFHMMFFFGFGYVFFKSVRSET